MICVRIEAKITCWSIAERREPVHFLLNRKDLLAAAGALSLCHRRLKHVDEAKIVFWRQRIQELFYEMLVSRDIID